MDEALKQLGFADAEETALGATIVNARIRTDGRARSKQERDHLQLLPLGQLADPEILSRRCCATWRDVLSPMQAHCKRIKEKDPGAYTVFIGPCIAKKDEADAIESTPTRRSTFDELHAVDEGRGHRARAARSAKPKRARARASSPPRAAFSRRMQTKNTGYTLHGRGRHGKLHGRAGGAAKPARFDKVLYRNERLRGQLHQRPGASANTTSRACSGDLHVVTLMPAGRISACEPLDGHCSKQFAFIGTHGAHARAARPSRPCCDQMGKTTPDKELNCGCCGYHHLPRKGHRRVPGQGRDCNVPAVPQGKGRDPSPTRSSATRPTPSLC